jgi:transposase-like protein
VKRRTSQFRSIRGHRTAEEKAEILRAHQRSGLSLLGFSGKHGLCYASLLRWRSQGLNETNAVASPETEADPRFVPVKIEGEVLGGDYVLSWPDGRSLMIPRQFETDSLRRLLTVLEGIR